MGEGGGAKNKLKVGPKKLLLRGTRAEKKNDEAVGSAGETSKEVKEGKIALAKRRLPEES